MSNLIHMKKKPTKRTGPGYLLPLPDAKGIEEMRKLYREKLGKEIADEEAYDVLGRVMRHIYFTSQLEEDKPNP